MARLPILLLFLFHGIEAKEGQLVNVAALQTSLDNLHSTLFGSKEHHPRFGIMADTLGNVGRIIQRLDSVDSEIELITQAAVGFNKTLNQLVEENETLRNRQAAAAVLQVIQFLMVILYFLVIWIAYLVKCFEKAQAKQLEQNLQEMEERLQERKTKRRSANEPPKEL